MTCIVGLIENGVVYMGGDSAGVDGLDVIIRKDAKVFEKNGFLIGYTTSFRMGQLLRFKLEIPESKEIKKDLYEYMCTDFIESVRECFRDNGYMIINNNEEKGGCFLVGVNGRLFRIENDLQVGESILTYDAVGCGASYAKGAMHAIGNNSGLTASMKLTMSLDSACEFSAGVRGPYVLLYNVKSL